MIGPFIFLDIDGVLNGHQQHDNRYCGTDPESVKVLNGLLDATKAKIVLVSAWRYFILRGEMTLAGFNGLMHTHGLNFHSVVDHVGPDRGWQMDRAFLIREWFDNRYGTAHAVNFAILDDMDLGYSGSLLKHFFQTDGKVGLKGFGPEKLDRLESLLLGNRRAM